ncbi:MAG: low molecular weight protein arginine phosphatase [Candidatus Caldatribacteriota bacterium]|nr:low molecular weight protein arginine phosphatase [Candidatus Caldatribacteriota bacterium]
MTKTILFVCTGNTCRSAMAEGIFKKILKERTGDYSKFNIISAGISALPGINPTYEAISVMFEQGIDISQHHAQELREELIKKADLILVMTNEHKEYIHKKFPFAQNKTFLLKKFTLNNKFESKQNNERNFEIIDPIGRKIEFYRIVARELKKNLEKILDKIIKTSNKVINSEGEEI